MYLSAATLVLSKYPNAYFGIGVKYNISDAFYSTVAVKKNIVVKHETSH